MIKPDEHPHPSTHPLIERNLMNTPTQTNPHMATQAKSIISKSMTAERYMNLTDTERLILCMLDSFAPDENALAWPCDYDHLMKLAQQSPSISQHEAMTTITRLKGLKILDSSHARDGAQLAIWVSPWAYRHQLLHAINDELIQRRANPSTSPSTTESTQAA
jgi:hypothetical protein